jgi:hypothetical protein
MAGEGIFVGLADGKDLTNPIGGGMVVKLRDEDTAGAYSVHDNTIPPGSPAPHPPPSRGNLLCLGGGTDRSGGIAQERRPDGLVRGGAQGHVPPAF